MSYTALLRRFDADTKAAAQQLIEDARAEGRDALAIQFERRAGTPFARTYVDGEPASAAVDYLVSWALAARAKNPRPAEWHGCTGVALFPVDAPDQVAVMLETLNGSQIADWPNYGEG